VRNFKAALEAVYSGPLYTHPTKRDTDKPAKTFSQDQFNKQYGSRGKADIDPFISVETYSQKYNPPKRTLPNLKPVILDKKLFPQELWITLDGEEGREVKRHLDSVMQKKAEAETMADPTLSTSKDLNKLLLETIKRVAGEEDNDGEAEEVEKETGPDEEEDYDYEEDEGDMGGDYDAEKYFDDGENDEEDGEAGGDDY
jgi:DNA-directed RNA polymerase III subunit RPC7